ncbi:MAG: hypothetical protein H6Q04_3528, partial [Acidobacteria bacterium]|nr:hypothetical protein [Acidobacteriota bacterium]
MKRLSGNGKFPQSPPFGEAIQGIAGQLPGRRSCFPDRRLLIREFPIAKGPVPIFNDTSMRILICKAFMCLVAGIVVFAECSSAVVQEIDKKSENAAVPQLEVPVLQDRVMDLAGI